jgi:ketosteroid isomerase-like protein
VKRIWCTAILGFSLALHAQTTQKPNNDMGRFLQQISDTRKTIADSYVRWAEAVKSKNVGAIVSMYADDATILPDEKEAVSGKDAIRKFYEDWLAGQGTLTDETFKNINSVQEGSLLIDSTTYSGTLVKDGKEARFTGKRMVVWKREVQGPWKILRDIWNRSEARN